MRALFDVNMLLAQFDSEHVHHRRARDWLIQHGDDGWATCPLTENGFVRIATQPSYTNPLRLEEALRLFRRQTKQPGHAFWPDDISIADPTIFDHARVLGPGQITDVYLLALAVKNGGRLVTFDRGIPLSAVVGARPEHIAVI